MLVLITYDVNTQTAAGVRRLAWVAKKICTNYGQRAQNSVFECIVDRTVCHIEKQLKDIIDVDKDSVEVLCHGGKV